MSNGRLLKFDVQVYDCDCCGKTAINAYGEQRRLLEYQRRTRGMVWYHSERDGKILCEECAAAGKGAFTCALCGESRSLSLEQESFGYPAESLCTPCFETTPAKIWCEKVDKLTEDHRYDFE
jgi:hypothetical protein